MNKIPCEVIQDLLPSYIDGLTSEETNKIIDEHIEGCSKCSNSLKLMRREAEAEVLPDEDDELEIDFLKKTKSMWKKTFIISIAAVVLCGLMILLRVLIVGRSYDYKIYTVDKLEVQNDTVDIKVSTAGSKYVVSRMKFEEKNGILSIRVNVVPANIFCSKDREITYKLKKPELLKTIKLGQQIIWEDEWSLSPLASMVYPTKHAYLGDMSANIETARALNAYNLLGDFDNELQTSAEPYGWTLRLKEDISGDRQEYVESDMQSIAYVLIGTIGNLDHVRYEYSVDGSAKTLSFDAAEATAFLGCDIKECSSSGRILDELIGKTGLKKNIFY